MYNRNQEKLTGITETKVVIKGNMVLIPVTLSYQSKETDVLLLFDTGASIIALHEDVAEELQIKPGQKAFFKTAGGDKVEANITRLDQVEVGPFIKRNISRNINYILSPEIEAEVNQPLLRLGEEYKIHENVLKNHHEKTNGKGTPLKITEHSMDDIENILIFVNHLFAYDHIELKIGDGKKFLRKEIIDKYRKTMTDQIPAPI